MIAVGLKDKPGADVDIESIFLSDGADGAIRKLVVDAFIDAGDIVLAEEFTYSGTVNMLLSKRGGERILEITDSGWRRCHTGFLTVLVGFGASSVVTFGLFSEA